MQHGSMNINSKWGMYNGDADQTPVASTPSTYNVFDPADYTYGTKENNYADGVVEHEHAVEKTTVLSLTAEYFITSGLSANLAADFVFVKNQGNVADNNCNDIQLTLGLRYEI